MHVTLSTRMVPAKMYAEMKTAYRLLVYIVRKRTEGIDLFYCTLFRLKTFKKIKNNKTFNIMNHGNSKSFLKKYMDDVQNNVGLSYQ